MPVKGYLQTKEHRQKLSNAHKGRPSPALGKTWKLSETTKKKMRRSKVGEKHWNWKGGISKINVRIRRTFKYREWRKNVFARDNWTCTICGKKGVYVEADHYPKLFSELLKENKISTINEALECEELWDIENGRTLCKECYKLHGRRH